MPNESGSSLLIQAASALRQTLLQWDDFFLRDMAGRFDRQTRGAVGGFRSMRGFDTGRFRDSRETLLPGLRTLQSNGNADLESLLTAAGRLRAVLPSPAASTDTPDTEVAELNQSLEEFIAAAMQPEGQGSSFPASADTNQPADGQVEFAPASTSTSPAGFINPASNQGPHDSSERRTAASVLAECADWLAGQSQPGIDDWLTSLQQLAMTIGEPERGRDDAAAGRSLTSLLGQLDTAMTDSRQRKSPVCVSLRDRLRDVLTEFFGYQILDRELIGQPLSRLRDRVRIRSVSASSTFPSDHITSVYRPGYLLRSSQDRSLTVVRPAEVCVSR